MRTLEQIRAEFAWERVRGRTGEYRNLAKSAPALVMSNGLMQTLAFLEGKGGNDHRKLLGDLCAWLAHERLLDEESRFPEAMQRLYEMGSIDYQRATEESLAILRWIRQLADAAGGNGDGRG